MGKITKHYLTISFAVISIAIGVYFFKFPNNFTFGGITGLAVIIAKLGWMTASNFTIAANVLLLILGFFILGKEFAAKTAYCSILLSLLLWVLEKYVPLSTPLTTQPLLELIFAIALPAFGSALLFNAGTSSGGMDIIAMILKRYTPFEIGPALISTDVITTTAGFFVFGIENGLYSLLAIAVRSLMIDNFIESLNLSKYFNVVCTSPDPICDFIVHELHRSATVTLAQGAFSGEDRYIIFIALNRIQAVKLRNYVREQEPSAFIMISNTSQIIGKGFHSF